LLNLNDKKIYYLYKLNSIEKYKDYIFLLIFFLISLQFILSIFSINIFFIMIAGLFSFLEIPIIIIIKEVFENKKENFTMYFPFLFLILYIFFTVLLFIIKNSIIYLLQNINFFIFLFFIAIHSYLYHNFPDKNKINLGIISGIFILFISFLNFIFFYYTTNIILSIQIFTINLLIFGILGLSILCLHITYGNTIY
jgi:hypothetical protein